MNRPLMRDKHGHSFGEILGEIGTSAKDLVQSEINLARAEIKDSAVRLGQHAAESAIFGALVAISVLPFLAFLVIGLGRLLGDNYWASSLIVAVICASVGGVFARRSYNRLKQDDFSLPRTREKIQDGKNVLAEEVQEAGETAASNVRDIRDAVTGKEY